MRSQESPVGKLVDQIEHQLFPARMAGISDRPDDDPLILEGQRQQFGEERFGDARVGADDARQKSYIDAGSCGLGECAALA